MLNNILNNQKGFSLLEIMIAVAILATSVTVLLTAQGRAFLSSERSEELMMATFLARQKMVELEIEIDEDIGKNKFPESKVEKEGVFDEPNEGYRWAYVIDKVEIPVLDQGDEQNALVKGYVAQVMDQISKSVREIKFTIYWGDADKPIDEQQQFTITTHLVKL